MIGQCNHRLIQLKLTYMRLTISALRGLHLGPC
jgi:hypothetical protein